jgi:hypothetical protein
MCLQPLFTVAYAYKMSCVHIGKVEYWVILKQREDIGQILEIRLFDLTMNATERY